MNDILYACDGFEWDEGNSDKNWYLHQVNNEECEEIFFNQPLIIAADGKHSQQEQRYYALGRTNQDRWLFIAFTVRVHLIRVISARDMNQRETTHYANRIQKYTDL